MVVRFKEFLNEVDDAKLLKRFANKQGVDLLMRTGSVHGPASKHIPYPKDWYVGWLGRRGHPLGDEPKPGQKLGEPGAGQKVLRAIHKQADKRGKHVTLTPDNETLGDKVYSKHGYQWTGPEKEYMRRED